ncbi:MAG: hybrid sensor histidine kinase/response regulator [Sodalinema sp.]|uniref:ATP-binding response regulator n=1 Tax=Sodalinema sp. TaxID=3080550 RepID=UPI001222F11D|nr:MAG: hybrid sensor histidine kinase/response regulator [Phormidium sp. SL48-SHIP]
MDCLNLQPFVQPVPICYRLDSLATVIDKFQQSDRILVIDEKQTPLGVIVAHRLLPYLQDARVWQHPLLSFSKAMTPIDTLAIDHWGDRLCSRISLAKIRRLKLFEPVASGGRRDVVIVDASGRIFGLLDGDRLNAELSNSPSTTLPDDSQEANSPDLEVLTRRLEVQTQELTAKNADLMQIDRQKTELLSWVSHELKTPLTALLGLSNLLQNPNLGSLNPRQANYARLIQQSSREMMTVVNDLCDLAQLENGELSLDRQQLSVQACSQAAYEQIRKLRDGSRVPQLTLDIAPEADQVWADRTRLNQILVHLFLNAVSTTPDSGTIGLRVERWHHWLAFLVWDTGTGIEAAAQPWIFQGYPIASSSQVSQMSSFAQDASESTATSTEAPSSRTAPPSLPTGLGRVLAQRLARLHGGEISFTSQDPGGSQFTLLLPSPRDSEGAPPPETPSRFNAWAKDAQVRFALVVDRDSERVEALCHYLGEAGYRVFLARSGPEALAKARQLHPCVLFLNPRLPILSGWDVLTLLKADPVSQDLPLVLLGQAEEGAEAIAQRGLETVVDWLTLPVDRHQLQQVLTRLLAHQGQASRFNRPLTLLWLVSPHRGEVNPSLSLERVFHHYHYRVIEVDDFDQAGLLVKVWKPDVVLLDLTGSEADRQDFLATLQEHPGLTQLPIVTLDSQTTALANRGKTADGRPLRVFPCLTAPERISETSGLPAVVEVVRIAANASG